MKLKFIGARPLYVAAENGHVETLKYLVDNGAEVNQCRNDGISPFFVAAENGQLETLKFLQSRGAGTIMHPNSNL